MVRTAFCTHNWIVSRPSVSKYLAVGIQTQLQKTTGLSWSWLRVLSSCRQYNSSFFRGVNTEIITYLFFKGDYLVLHLPDLVRMAFMAATSDCDPLRLEGLQTLHQIIDKFAKVPEPEFPGHLLLEQFQAQVINFVLYRDCKIRDHTNTQY